MKALPANRNIWSRVRRLVCGAAVYYIWQEKNNRLFKNEKKDSNTILNTIKETVGMKLIGIKVKESKTVKRIIVIVIVIVIIVIVIIVIVIVIVIVIFVIVIIVIVIIVVVVVVVVAGVAVVVAVVVAVIKKKKHI
ncbi:hypothetical protein Tco_0606704 [Tanacetum coccineum]